MIVAISRRKAGELARFMQCEHIGRLPAGNGLLLETGAGSMSLDDAHAFAFSLATTRMSVIVIFRAGDGTLAVAPASEYDGELSEIVREIDPFAP